MGDNIDGYGYKGYDEKSKASNEEQSLKNAPEKTNDIYSASYQRGLIATEALKTTFNGAAGGLAAIVGLTVAAAVFEPTVAESTTLSEIVKLFASVTAISATIGGFWGLGQGLGKVSAIKNEEVENGLAENRKGVALKL